MFTLSLEQAEADALLNYHHEKEMEYSRQQLYIDADRHKRRRLQLKEMLDAQSSTQCDKGKG